MNKESSKLFTPLNIRSLEFKNRIFVSPMCQYSANDGVPNNWHTVHLGTRAVGGASLVMAEGSKLIEAAFNFNFVSDGLIPEQFR